MGQPYFLFWLCCSPSVHVDDYLECMQNTIQKMEHMCTFANHYSCFPDCILLSLHFMIQESNLQKELLKSAIAEAKSIHLQKDEALSDSASSLQADTSSLERFRRFLNGVDALTPTERSIYDYYLEKKTTKEIMELLNIKENTLKFHNKNIYSKLEVSSRKELMAVANELAHAK